MNFNIITIILNKYIYFLYLFNILNIILYIIIIKIFKIPSILNGFLFLKNLKVIINFKSNFKKFFRIFSKF